MKSIRQIIFAMFACIIGHHCAAAPGLPDLTFGNNGVFILPPQSGTLDAARHVTTNGSGRIFVTGSTKADMPPGTLGRAWQGDSIVALRSNGQLDTTFAQTGFGRSGFVATTETHGDYVFPLANGQVIQVQRRTLVCGTDGAPACGSLINGSPSFYAQRFNVDGALDLSYGLFGNFNFGGDVSAVFATLLGELTVFSTYDGELRVTKLSANGQLVLEPLVQNATAAMKACAQHGSFPHLDGVARFSDGRFLLVFGRYLSVPYRKDMCWLRLAADGNLETTFGPSSTPGTVVTFHEGIGAGIHLLTQPNGGAVLIHQTSGIARPFPWLCDRLTWMSPTGQIESMPYQSGPSPICQINSGVFQPDGKLVIAGFDYLAGKPSVVRFDSTGALDQSFGAFGGVSLFTIDGITFNPSHVHIDAAGAIYLAGNGSGTKFAVVKLLGDDRPQPPPIDSGGVSGGGGGCGTIHGGRFDPTFPGLLLLSLLLMGHARLRQLARGSGPE